MKTLISIEPDTDFRGWLSFRVKTVLGISKETVESMLRDLHPEKEYDGLSVMKSLNITKYNDYEATFIPYDENEFDELPISKEKNYNPCNFTVIRETKGYIILKDVHYYVCSKINTDYNVYFKGKLVARDRNGIVKYADKKLNYER